MKKELKKINNMTNEKSNKNKRLEKRQNKIWAGEDGILYIILAKTLTEEDIWAIMDKLEEKLRELSGRAKILIKMTTISVIRSSQFRKIISEKIKKIAIAPGFEKAAICGGNIILRTIASFIIGASGIKNIKIFSDEKEAIKWFKKS